MLLWTQAVRVFEFASQISVTYRFLYHVNHAGNGAARRAALHA